MNLHWLKLHTDILDDQKIRIVRRMPAGNDLFVLWIGLLCLAMKSRNPGTIEIDEGIPFDPQELAAHFDLQVDTVKMGLTAFRRLRMIEWETGTPITLINFRKHQSLDRIEYQKERNRIKNQRWRESRSKLQIEGPKSDNRSVTGHSVTNDRIEKRRGEKKREDKKKRKIPSASQTATEIIEDAQVEGNILFDHLYRIREQQGTLPIAGGPIGRDHRELFGKAARETLDAIAKQEGIEEAKRIFTWASHDKFWGSLPIVASKFNQYKAAAGRGPGPKMSADELADRYVEAREKNAIQP